MPRPMSSPAVAAHEPREFVWVPTGSTDWMDEFGEEAHQSRRAAPAPAAAAPTAIRDVRSRERTWWVAALAIVGLLALAQAPIVMMWGTHLTAPPPSAVPAPGTLVVETVPAGVGVQVDGMPAGVTPLRATLPSGRRSIVLSHEGRERSIVLQLGPGQVVQQRFDFGEPPPAVQQPPAPKPAAAASLRAVPAGALSGWVRIDVPASMRIVEEGRLLGTTDVDRLMLPVGEHRLDLTSDELRFSTQQVVMVTAGETVTVPIRLPTVPLSINARPWAEVWVDGERLGDTPLGNVLRPIGRHTVVLRHPELGERRESVLLTTAQPGLLSVDLRPVK